MSLKAWRAEFYPKPASRVSRAEALAHSLQKWKGLTKAALKRYEVELGLFGTLVDATETFCVASESCALCAKYLVWYGGPGTATRCAECPLAISRGGVSCDRRTAAEATSPYHQFIERGDARPMIRALQKAVRDANR